MRTILVGGVYHPINFDILDGRELGMFWEPNSRGARRRKYDPRAVIWHHTGGEGGTKQIYRTLNGGRKKDNGDPIFLSIHFTIDWQGIITQHADPMWTTCLHAGKANPWSAGVEVANRGRAPARSKRPRVVYSDEMHGRKLDYLRFYPAQVGAAYDLGMALSELCRIPWKFPFEDGRVARRVLTKIEQDRFHGHLGHCHVSRRKIGPSPHLLDELRAQASIAA